MNMKKHYIIPQQKVVDLGSEEIIALSNPTIGVEEGEDGDEGRAREYSSSSNVWDKEW